jgi:hypothetical protein
MSLTDVRRVRFPTWWQSPRGLDVRGFHAAVAYMAVA